MKTVTLFSILLIFVLISLNSIVYGQCSVVIIQDVSTSMSDALEDGSMLEISKESLKNLINNLNLKSTEIAITQFAGDAIGHPTDPVNKPLMPFSNDKERLLESIKSTTILYAGTNWNAAFLNKLTNSNVKNLSGLYYSNPSIAKYQPIIIFITDGDHLVKGAVQAFEVDKVISTANSNNAKIYTIQLNNYGFANPVNEANFKKLAHVGKAPTDLTDNYWLNIQRIENLSDILNSIMNECDCNAVSVEDEISSNTMEIFPNPANNQIRVQLPESVKNGLKLEANIELLLYNSLGKELKSFVINDIRDLDNFKINIEDMQSGVYFVGIKSNFINEFVKLSVIK